MYKTLDGHCDSLILRQIRQDPINLTNPQTRYQVDLKGMKEAGVTSIVMMVGASNLHQSSILIDAVHRLNTGNTFTLCRSKQEVLKANRAGRIGLLMSIEGQVMFQNDLSHLYNWHRLGVRMMSLTHGEGRATALQHDAAFFGYLSPSERVHYKRQSKGLTAYAKEVIQAMNELGIVLDLSHCNDRSFWEALEISTGPVCVSHGNCYAQCEHVRNYDDEMLKALAKKGGVIGMALYKPFIDRTDATLDRLADHFIHALEVMGEDHVGLGTDFDGIPKHEVPVITGVSKCQKIWKTIEKRGVKKTIIKKCAFDNFINLFE